MGRKEVAARRREQIALDLSEKLIGTGISVSACSGGYTVMAIRLGAVEAEDMANMLREWRRMRDERREARHRILDELAQEAQDLDMGY